MSADLVERLEGARTVVMAVSADFYPEDTPKGFVEWTFAAPAEAPFGAGLYELRFVRLLTDEERATRDGQYEALRARQNTGEEG